MCKGTQNIKASVSKQEKFHHAVIDIHYDWNTILREGVQGSGLGIADECPKCIQNVTFQLLIFFEIQSCCTRRVHGDDYDMNTPKTPPPFTSNNIYSRSMTYPAIYLTDELAVDISTQGRLVPT